MLSLDEFPQSMLNESGAIFRNEKGAFVVIGGREGGVIGALVWVKEDSSALNDAYFRQIGRAVVGLLLSALGAQQKALESKPSAA
jgi:hypothetical protein